MAVNLWLVSGWRTAGKTTFCSLIAEKARSKGADVAGVLSRGVFNEKGEKTRILAVDLRTGANRCLAGARKMDESNLEFGDWFFDRQTLSWGNQVLKDAVPCGLLIVDELGPLEFVFQNGWQEAFNTIESRQYRQALTVVRPELLQVAKDRFKPARVIEIDDQHPAARLAEELFPELSLGC